jgi:hypothetical protein
MPKRSSKKGSPSPDPNTAAFDAVERLLGVGEGTNGKNPAAVLLGRLGGQKGGPARAKKLTPAKRRAIAKKAARARWGNGKENE